MVKNTSGKHFAIARFKKNMLTIIQRQSQQVRVTQAGALLRARWTFPPLIEQRAAKAYNVTDTIFH